MTIPALFRLQVFWSLIAMWSMVGVAVASDLEKPNILWLVVDDMSPHMGCYGGEVVTPNIDRLAERGTLFKRAYVTAPICSTARSALITGMYQTTIGAHHHRSGRGAEKIRLPEGVRLIPDLMREAGYWTSNALWRSSEGGLVNDSSRTDYNFEWDASVYDGTDWKERTEGKPFFAQLHLQGGKVRDRATAGEIFRKALGDLTPPERVQLPPYYPDTAAIREDWALTLDAIRYTDMEVGEIVDQLKAEGVLENTVIFFVTDHGVSHGRGKQFLYDEGTRVPLIVAGPGVPAGRRRDELVVHIDMAAATLGLGGVPLPAKMEARDFLSPTSAKREHVVVARDRADETVDSIRSVRTIQFNYIRNFYPERPHLQPNDYKDNKPCYVALRAAREAGLLNEIQERLLFSPTRSPEELYDLEKDPWELTNVVNDPAYAEPLAELRGKLAEWQESSGDRGRTPESEAMYDSDMKVYLDGRRKYGRTDGIEKNIALMKRWAKEGK